MYDIIIFGGGLSGLTLAHELIKNGFKVVIYANHLIRAAHPAMVNVAKNILKKRINLEKFKKNTYLFIRSY